MLVNADLHIHSRFSAATSEKMRLPVLAKEALKKGIHLLATGDCLHPAWLKEIKELNKVSDGTLELNATRFVLTTEVEDCNRVHHLIIFPSLSAVEEFRTKAKNKAPNLDTDGRPNIAMTGEELAELAEDVDALIGCSHAFTPWTALYAYHNSLKDCYGDLTYYVSFVELGLSADTSYADRIKELADKTFLTNSDSHSPYPLRLAREFNRFELEEINFEELKKAILRQAGRKIVLNVGVPPQEGKYNETACIKCYKHYELRAALELRWRCNNCGARIKKGVKDRVDELADCDRPIHPEHRPPYLHLIPLSEIIAKALKLDSPITKRVFETWSELVKNFGSEVSILIDTAISAIAKVADVRITNAIKAFREGKIIVHPGGGGRYGAIELPENLEEHGKKTSFQKKIFEF
ncbi:MAG: TIGR00375 family protein [Candidatus Thermoplasmatota archaeon]|nr:TIGR00375 family protein [Candidatus Thermoplasmatota archaeon]